LGWKIKIIKTAEKQIVALSASNQKRIVKFLRERFTVRDSPRQLGQALRGDKATPWRYRVGDYRLICNIEDASKTVTVLEVGHRRDIYRSKN
jgi:mRNA interferase RelE/StbE